MGFDIVRGKITKPEQSNQLIEAVQEYMDKNAATGTLYLGYPLTANADEAITVPLYAAHLLNMLLLMQSLEKYLFCKVLR